MRGRALGYAIWCQRGECERCRYHGCECPHHDGGKADARIVANYYEWHTASPQWMGADC